MTTPSQSPRTGQTQPVGATTPSATLSVAQLWRYPVKSMQGERLSEAWLGPDGVAGDRLVHVQGNGGLLTGRTRGRLLRLRATTGADGRPLVEGDDWQSEAVAVRVRAAAGPPARLVAYSGRERFDILPLLVATDGEIARFGYDERRLRPNLVIAGVAAREERSWPGRAIRIGADVMIGVYALRSRCVVTTFDPDSGAQDLDVLRHIRQQFAGQLALDCWVIRGGRVRPGDNVAVTDLPATIDGVPVDETMPTPGGWVTGAPYAGVGANAHTED